MVHPIASSITKVLEFLVLAILVGSWLWVTFFAPNYLRTDTVV